jgi:hypothetical protein
LRTETADLGKSLSADQSVGAGAHVGLLALVAGLTIVVQILTANGQISDTNFYTLWEATALLAGDHPYRDFFEWGVPLQMAVSAFAQVLVGHRLIGEFLIQWLFIVLGMVLAFHLSLRLSRSVVASLATTVVTFALLASTPTYHYPKLFFYPLAVWVSWRYMDRPRGWRAAALGLVTAAAFLFRHDHGLYVGVTAAMALVLARLAEPLSRNLRSFLQHGAAYAGALGLIVVPWATFVQMNEGLVKYVESRAEFFADYSSKQSPYHFPVFAIDPARALIEITMAAPWPVIPRFPARDWGLIAITTPAPQPATVRFEWDASVGDGLREQLARQHRLRLVVGPDWAGRWQYEIPDRGNTKLLELLPYIKNTERFEWDRLRELTRSPLARVGYPVINVAIAPGIIRRDNAVVWIHQVVVWIPVISLVILAPDLVRRRLRSQPVPGETYHLILAAALLVIVDRWLLREKSYAFLVAPLTAALGAWLLTRATSRSFREPQISSGGPWPGWLWMVIRRAFAVGVLLVTGVAALLCAHDTGLFQPRALADTLRPTFEAMVAFPPIDGLMPPDSPIRHNRADRDTPISSRGALVMRYLYECTRPQDRLLVTGSTPFQVGYYTDRRIAGGHLFWHHGWRSDPGREMQSLALLETQSVPFVFSTTYPVLEDFTKYPRIREHLLKHYVELNGTQGFVLVDRRRQATGRFEPFDLPCFR